MDARPLRMLSGEEIVAKGRNVTNCILPEVGTKEVTPNGTWLETKQIQTALEARNALVAAERIDKVGALSHAEWRDLLKLAEVTQQVGGHWQYIGHNVNGTFYLLPEEALYLIETNCLLLRHNDVIVSLQKAYNLLLDDKMTLKQYKVYASLSRVGYKVFRHEKLNQACRESNVLVQDKIVAEMETNSNEPTIPVPLDCNDSKKDSIILSALSSDEITSNKQCKMSSDQPPLPKSLPKDTPHGNGKLPNNGKVSIHGTGVSIDSKVIFSIDNNGVVRLQGTENCADIKSEASATSNFQSTKTDTATNTDITTNTTTNTDTNIPSHMLNSYKVNKHKLLNRKIKPSDAKSMHDKFKDIPDFHNEQIVTVNVPCEDYLPRNVFLNKSSYELNAKKCSTRLKSTPTSGNSAMYRTIKNSSESEEVAVRTPDIPQLLSNTPSYQQPHYLPAWRPRYQPIQRPFFPQHRFNRHQVYRIPPINVYRPQGFYRTNLNHMERIRRRNLRDDHLRAVRKVAQRLKHSRAPNINVKRSLVELLARFNEIYNERMIVTPEFNIVKNTQNTQNTQNVETIEVDDEEVNIEKPLELKKRLESSTFDKYLAKVKEIAARLRLVRKNQPLSKQKRAFCNLLKNFNKIFDVEFCLDDNGILIDKKLVILDSSDDDVVVTDGIDTSKSKKRSSECDDIDSSIRKKTKVIRNPFSVLNKINEGASTSRAAIEIPVESSTNPSKYFDTNWLRNEDDFGKATICSKMDARHLMNDSQLLFDFMDEPDAFQNWIDLKVAFCMYMEGSTFDHDMKEHSNLTMDNSRLKPILQEETAGDWAASLEKLRIIKTNTDVQETSLRVDFDVYNRDVQNFRKTDPPKPHFRVVCVDESSDIPSGAEVRALHSKHQDNVTIVFAVVGVGSINYLQINPTDLPIYVGND